MSIRTLMTGRRGSRTLLAALMLGTAATTAEAMRYVLTGRIPSGARREHAVWVGLNDNRIIVRGTPGEDIDCWVYDADGTLVDSDTDETATCVLATPGVGSHQLAIRNYGTGPSSYTVWQDQ